MTQKEIQFRQGLVKFVELLALNVEQNPIIFSQNFSLYILWASFIFVQSSNHCNVFEFVHPLVLW